MGHPFYTHSGGRLRDEPHSSSIAYITYCVLAYASGPPDTLDAGLVWMGFRFFRYFR